MKELTIPVILKTVPCFDASKGSKQRIIAAELSPTVALHQRPVVPVRIGASEPGHSLGPLAYIYICA